MDCYIRYSSSLQVSSHSSSFGGRTIGTRRVSYPEMCGGVLLLEDLFWSNNKRKLSVASKNMAIHSRVTRTVVYGIRKSHMWSRSYEKLLPRRTFRGKERHVNNASDEKCIRITLSIFLFLCLYLVKFSESTH